MWQTLGDSRAAEYMKGRKTLEINPSHPIIQALKERIDSDADGAKVRRCELFRSSARLSSASAQPVAVVPCQSLSFCSWLVSTYTWAHLREVCFDRERNLALRQCQAPVDVCACDRGTPLQAVAELMYDTALVTSGFTVESPREFAARIYNMVGLAVNAAPAAADAAAAATAVDPEILGADPNDPWKKE